MTDLCDQMKNNKAMKPIRATALKRIQRWSLSVFSAHSKGKTHREVTNLHLDHHLLVESLHHMLMCAFTVRGGKKSVY